MIFDTPMITVIGCVNTTFNSVPALVHAQANRNDHYVHCAGESSSYGDSEDSDWSPGVKDDSENVGELVAEAKDFMSNKKMRRTT